MKNKKSKYDIVCVEVLKGNGKKFKSIIDMLTWSHIRKELLMSDLPDEIEYLIDCLPEKIVKESEVSNTNYKEMSIESMKLVKVFYKENGIEINDTSRLQDLILEEMKDIKEGIDEHRQYYFYDPINYFYKEIYKITIDRKKPTRATDAKTLTAFICYTFNLIQASPTKDKEVFKPFRDSVLKGKQPKRNFSEFNKMLRAKLETILASKDETY